MSLVAILRAKGESVGGAACEKGFFLTPAATLLGVALLAGFGHFDGR